MRWNLLSLFAGHNDSETRAEIERREREAKDAAMLNRLRRAQIVDELYANMTELAEQEPHK